MRCRIQFAAAWLGRALAALFLAATACTPISEVGSKEDAATVEPGSCRQDTDCIIRSPCLSARCVRGMCLERPEPSGTELAADQQVDGDCNKFVCDGRGQPRKQPDDADAPRTNGNPCQKLSCENGALSVSDLPDDASCNDTGTCLRGTCSVCLEGRECSRADDCTIYRDHCTPQGTSCDDTGVARGPRPCGSGKVCDNGRCVPCVVGAECPSRRPCYASRVVSCDNGMECDERPLTGPSCGTDADGKKLYCSAGACEQACRDEPCASSANPCEEARWQCGAAASSCTTIAREDGLACGDNARCHAGVCATGALVNGDFSRGRNGWSATGDGARFLVAVDQGNAGLPSLSTSPDGRNSGGSARGTLSQTFSVPSDALGLHFVVSGGHAHVRLKDASGATLEDCTGRDSDLHVPVSWDLSGRRGQQLTLAIEDDVGSGDWAFIRVSGFDLIRELDGPLHNAQFIEGFDGWVTEGSGLRFQVFDAHNHYDGLSGVDMYGRRRTISTYTVDRTGGTAYGEASQGSVSQEFSVPPDAVALRFNVHGGHGGRIALLSGDQVLYTVTGPDSDSQRVLQSWPLQSHRGKLVRLVVQDDSSLPPWGYLGTTGFDLITSYNGP